MYFINNFEKKKYLFTFLRNQTEKISIGLPFAKLIPIIDKSDQIYHLDNSVLNVILTIIILLLEFFRK